MIFIIKFFIIYYIAGTFLLLNILFNPAVHFKVTSKKTGKIVDAPTWFLITYCIWWIIFLPISLNNAKKENENNDE